VGCGSPPPTAPHPQALPMVSLPAPPPPAPLVATATPSPTVAWPEPIAELGCRFGKQRGRLLANLDFLVGQRRFATLHGEVQIERLEIAKGATRAIAAVDDGRLHLVAEVAVDTLRVGQRVGATPLEGWLEIRAGEIEQARDGAALIGVQLPRGFTPVQPMAAEVPCEELRVVETVPFGVGTHRLQPGARVPFALAPGGPVFGHVDVAPAGPLTQLELDDVAKLEVQGKHAKVRLIAWQASVVGWVPDANLVAASQGAFGMLGGFGGRSDAKVTCDAPVGLRVEDGAGEDGVHVGELHPHETMRASRAADGRLHILTREERFDMVGSERASAALFIDPDDVAHCTFEASNAAP
ncbi:MAG: hypothetical protein KC731_10350, partial [Myxococcales bacterium]|nr:hypothetical protein [Myxococcales bacterium]